MDVTWSIEEIEAPERSEVEDVLHRLVDPEGPSEWRTEPHKVEVRRRLSGFGGATVLQIAVFWRPKPTLRVVKIGPAEELLEEHRAHETVARPNMEILFTPVETATRASPHSDGRREAVVYQDVSQYAGVPGAPVITLEDLFVAASLGDEGASGRATAAIAGLFEHARSSLYLGPRVGEQPTSLRRKNADLAPDITIQPIPGTEEHRPLWPKDVFDAGTTDPYDPGGVRITELVRLESLESLEVLDHGRALLARNTQQHVAALVAPTPNVTRTPAPLTGEVMALRLGTARERIEKILGRPEHVPVIRRALTALRPALTEVVLPEVSSAVHGDLNSRNVLLVATPTDRGPFLIDYARARPDGSLLADFAWLEINLVRAVEGEPGLAGHLRLQRLLAATSYLFVLTPDEEPEPVPPSLVDCLRSASGGLTACFPVLHRLRWEAFRTYPEERRGSWFADYRRHLVVAAHRTFKWPDTVQTPGRWIASTAVAAVAGEWSDPGDALHDWEDDEVIALAAAPPGWLGRSGAARVLGALSAEIDHRPNLTAATGEALVTAANAVATELAPLCPVPATARPFVDLRAEDLGQDTTEEVDSALAAIMERESAVLVGGYGSGKSTVLRELAVRLRAVAGQPGNATGAEWHRLPILIDAGELTADEAAIRQAVRIVPPETAHDLLRAGCLHLLIDGTTDTVGEIHAYAEQIRRRYPRTPVVVTTRTLPDSCPVIRLLPPTTAQAVAFLTEVAAHRGIPVSAVRRLLSTGIVRRTAELLHVPLLLRMMSDHLQPEADPPGIGDLLDQHFAGDGPEWDHARRLAAHRLDHDTETVDESPELEGRLIDRQALQRRGGRLHFSQPVYRDYFAATAAAADESSWPDRARRRSWREPLRIAVSRRASPPGLLTTVLPLVEEFDPVHAGRLLEASADVGQGLAEAFAVRLAGVLADPQAGAVAAGRAATALLSLGENGRGLLRAVTADLRWDEESRLAALRALNSTDEGRDELLALLRDLLVDRAQPVELRIAAASAAGELDAAQLAVVVADGCGTDLSWRYLQVAGDALASMRVAPSPRLRAVRRETAGRWLTEAAGRLPALTRWDEIDLLQDDREEILTRVLGDDLDLLIDHRFAFGLDEAVGDAIDRVRDDARDDVARLLTGTAGADELLATFGSGDDRLATAAAHGLLARHPERLPDLVAAVTPADRPARLLAAASAAPLAGVTCLAYVEGLALDLASGPPESSVTEALAALIWAAFRLDDVRGAHLARQVRATLLAAGDPRRLHWPISTVVAKSAPPPGRWEGLLTSTYAGDRALGAEALAAQGFHLDGSAPSAMTFTEVARQALREAEPRADAGWAAVEFVRAAATAGLVDALDLAEALLDQPDPDALVRTLPHGRYGTLTLTGRSEMLTAAGFLAREAFRTGQPDSVRAATSMAARIERLDPADAHPSVAAGRLIALGYLGNPVPLLEHLDQAEPRLHAAAKNAALQWATEGPYAAEPWRDAGSAADATARLLRERAGTGAARSTLLIILDEFVSRSGRLPAPSVTGRCE
ncbi:MAG: hypothetical protein ABW000_23935 [Actinoplanes sp.]